MKFCPKCKSIRIELFAGAITGQYHCKSCGLISPMILEKDIPDKKLKKRKNI